MALGIVIGIALTILLNGFATDSIRQSKHLHSDQRKKYMYITWLVPLIGAAYAMMKANQPYFEDQVVNEDAQRKNFEAWNLQHLNEGGVEGDIADADGE